jgi:hypothetical protein
LNPTYQSLLDKFQSRRKEFSLLVARLKKQKNLQLDPKIHRLHQNAFAFIDCLQCANCCRTLGLRLLKRDIQRLARYLKMKPSAFVNQYLRMDEDGDYVFQSMPCPFLGPDNFCAVYDVRPRACAEYPHTHQPSQQKIINLTFKNAYTCPAVAYIFEQLNK